MIVPNILVGGNWSLGGGRISQGFPPPLNETLIMARISRLVHFMKLEEESYNSTTLTTSNDAAN